MLPRCCFPSEYLQFFLPQALADVPQGLWVGDEFIQILTYCTFGNIKDILMSLVFSPILLLPEGLSILRHQMSISGNLAEATLSSSGSVLRALG